MAPLSLSPLFPEEPTKLGALIPGCKGFDIRQYLLLCPQLNLHNHFTLKPQKSPELDCPGLPAICTTFAPMIRWREVASVGSVL